MPRLESDDAGEEVDEDEDEEGDHGPTEGMDILRRRQQGRERRREEDETEDRREGGEYRLCLRRPPVMAGDGNEGRFLRHARLRIGALSAESSSVSS